MCIARWITVKGALAYIMSSRPWTISSPSMPEQRGAEDLLALGVDDDLHEALGLAALVGAADVLHRHLRDQRLDALAPDVLLGHAGAAEGWVDEQAVGRDPVLDPALFALEQVRRDDLEVVVGGVGEGPGGDVAVAHREDARDVGAHLRRR